MNKAYPEIYADAVRRLGKREGPGFGLLRPEVRGWLYDKEYERLCEARGLRPYTEAPS